MKGERKGCGPLIKPFADPNRSLRQQVFEHVRAAGLTSRIEVAKGLSVSPASVTTCTSELIEEGLLEEVAAPRAPTDSGRGRPPVALGVRADAYHVAGLKLSDRDFTAVVVDFVGKVIATETLPVPQDGQDVQTLLRSCATLIRAATQKAGLTLRDLAAVGMGVPGFVNNAAGVVVWSPVLQGNNVPLARAATEHLGVPVLIDNDANLVTMAELWFGVGREIADFAVVTIEHGVGMGFVVNHRILRGSNGLGTELGHTKVQLDGALCRCGQRGCLEAYVADYALAREATTALNWRPEQSRTTPMLLEMLYQEAKSGNAAAKAIFNRAGRYLAVGLANVANLFDPSLIILSGDRMKYDYLYAEEIFAELNDLVVNMGHSMPPIEVHAWGDLLWAEGAAALALSFLAEDVLMARKEAAQ